jgi:hypothetical protein
MEPVSFESRIVTNDEVKVAKGEIAVEVLYRHELYHTVLATGPMTSRRSAIY